MLADHISMQPPDNAAALECSGVMSTASSGFVALQAGYHSRASQHCTVEVSDHLNRALIARTWLPSPPWAAAAACTWPAPPSAAARHRDWQSALPLARAHPLENALALFVKQVIPARWHPWCAVGRAAALNDAGSALCCCIRQFPVVCSMFLLLRGSL